jgi:hypothetical protein
LNDSLERSRDTRFTDKKPPSRRKRVAISPAIVSRGERNEILVLRPSLEPRRQDNSPLDRSEESLDLLVRNRPFQRKAEKKTGAACSSGRIENGFGASAT